MSWEDGIFVMKVRNFEDDRNSPVYVTLEHKDNGFFMTGSGSSITQALKKMRAKANKHYRALRHAYYVAGGEEIKKRRDNAQGASEFVNQILGGNQ